MSTSYNSCPKSTMLAVINRKKKFAKIPEELKNRMSYFDHLQCIIYIVLFIKNAVFAVFTSLFYFSVVSLNVSSSFLYCLLFLIYDIAFITEVIT